MIWDKAKRLIIRAKQVARQPRTIKAAIICVSVIVAINLILSLVFWHRTYPNTRVAGLPIGNTPRASLGKRLDGLDLLPTSVKLKARDKIIDVKVSDLGVDTDMPEMIRQLKNQRAWLPVINIIRPPNIDLKLQSDKRVFDKKLAEIASELKQDAVDSRVVINNGVFSLQLDKTGYQVVNKLMGGTILRQLSRGSTTILLPTETLQPTVKQASLRASLENLQAQQKISITYRYAGKAVRPSTQDIGLWFAPKDSSYVVSTDKIQAYIKKVGETLGIQVKNLDQVAQATVDGLQYLKTVDVTLIEVPKPARIYSYCVATRGVDASQLSGFRPKLQAVYSDSRGWGLGGQVGFNEVSTGCNFTVWLSAASQMPTFGSICDPYWSCRVGPNVVINFDRWSDASPAWKTTTGSLDDYRSMVINHETGHWFGFGHLNCGGVGQLAPVMQQQSINLQGCHFNPWPLPSELNNLRASLGL